MLLVVKKLFGIKNKYFNKRKVIIFYMVLIFKDGVFLGRSLLKN